MNNITKKQLLIGALILLFVINIAALGTIIYQNYQDNQQSSPPYPPEQREWLKERLQKNRRPDKPERIDRQARENIRGFEYIVKRRLQLDEDQFEQFRSISFNTRKKQRDIARLLNQKRDSLMQELTKEQPDSIKMHQMASEIGELHTKLKTQTIDHFTQLKALCRPEQIERLNRMIMEMTHRSRHKPGADRNNHGPGRKHR